MGLETGNTIEILDQTWPLDGDFIDDGNDHLQLIKTVLKNIFPGAGGQGFNTQILASEAELNYSQGLTANIQDQIDNIIAGEGEFPIGTVMLFMQGSPPAGWNLQSTNNDSMVRIVSSGGGDSGGSDSPIFFNVQHSHTTASYALEVDEIPAHIHSMFVDNDNDLDVVDSDYVAAFYDTGTTGANSYRMKRASTGTPSLGKSSIAGGGFGAGIGDPGKPHGHGPTGTYINSFSPKYQNAIKGVKA